jgi:integrase/recombinase XerC
MTPAALEWLKRFRRYLTTERQLSRHTDTNYARDLEALVHYCDEAHLHEWHQIDSQHVRIFAARSHATRLAPKGIQRRPGAARSQARLAPKSIQRRLSAVRSFFEFLIRESLVARDDRARRSGKDSADAPPTPNVFANPAKDVRAPKAKRTLPNTLDADQMARLLELPAGDALVTRDRAIMELLYSSGLRLAELVGLNLTDLLSDRTVQVLGKGQKARIVPVGSKAHEALEAWQRERAGIARVGEFALFVGRNGRRLGPRAVQTRVAFWARRQGLGMHVHPHLFRHSFASHLLESSHKLRGVQELLGHADIATTQIYTHLDFQHLARIYDATHPRARKKVKAPE